MPWDNVPKSDWPKMEKCVNDVMAQGHDKESAIKICYTSITQESMNPIQLLWKGITDLFKPHLEPTPEPEQRSQTGGIAFQGLDPIINNPDSILFNPQPEQREQLVIRQADGRYRWFGVAATAVINHDNQIDSTRLFDSFIQHITDTHEYPVYDTMHLEMPCRLGQADFVMRDGAAYFASGTFDDNEFAQAAARELEQHPDYWGHSIAFVSGDPDTAHYYGVDIPVFTEGINQYISVVPRSRAASLFTDVTVQTRSKHMMNDEQYNELVRLVGKDLADKKKSELEQLNRTITEAGLVTRSQTDVAPVEPPAPVPPVTATPETPVVQPVTEEQRAEPTMTDVMTALADLQTQIQSIVAALSGAQAQTEQMAQRITAIEQPVEERIQQALDDAPTPKPQVVTRPSITRSTGTQTVDPTDTLTALSAQRSHRR